MLLFQEHALAPSSSALLQAIALYSLLFSLIHTLHTSGIKTDCEDPRFTYTFEDVYTQEYLQTKWCVRVFALTRNIISNPTQVRPRRQPRPLRQRVG